MWMKYFLLDDTNVTSSDMSVTCDTSINISKDKCGKGEPVGEPVGGSATRTNHDDDARCSCDEQLVKFKAFFLLFFAGFGSTFPYLGVYFKQIGLSASYVGVLAGIRPLIQFISGPFWALLADKYKARRGILLFSILAWLVMTLLLALPRPQHVVCRVSVNVGHPQSSRTNYTKHNENNSKNSNNNNSNNNNNNNSENHNSKTKNNANNKIQRKSMITYPDDFQGRFGFNLIYPHQCPVNNNTSNTISRRGESARRMIPLQRNTRFLYNSSEMVLSLEYDDGNSWNDKYWKRTQLGEDDASNRTLSYNNNNNNDDDNVYYIERDENEITQLFFIFLTLIVVGEFLEAPSFIMIDTALLDHLGTQVKYTKTLLVPF